jgi:hypothetical protein
MPTAGSQQSGEIPPSEQRLNTGTTARNTAPHSTETTRKETTCGPEREPPEPLARALQQAVGHAFDLSDRGQSLAHLRQAVVTQATHTLAQRHRNHVIDRGALEDQRTNGL